MKDDRSAIQYKDGQVFLFDSTYRTLIYSVILASMLALYVYLNNGPKEFVITWLAVITVMAIIRVIHCKIVISKNLFGKAFNLQLKIFIFLTFIMGLVWTSLYFSSLSYVDEETKYLIIISYGGMVAGATTTLGVYYPAYIAYTYTIFIPVIIYNFWLGDINHMIWASMYVLYLIALSTVSMSHQSILKKTFFLTAQNKDLLDKFEMLSITDALTGLYNRRHFTQLVQDEYNRTKHNQQSIVLISIDIDNFKLINDNFGHPFGDKFLIYTANYLKSYLAPKDGVTFRLGGDEFAAFIVNITEENIKKLCDEIKINFIKKPKFDYDVQSGYHKQILDQVSLSIGVVYIPYNSTTDMEHIVEKADQLLYQAKGQGKNEIKYTKIK